MSEVSSTPSWVPFADTFDARLALVRHEMGWNIREAATACGMAPQSWREWELAERLPRHYEAVCRQIAAVCGCDLIWLMTGIDADPHRHARLNAQAGVTRVGVKASKPVGLPDQIAA